MGRRHEQTFLQRRHTNGQQTNEKMLNITQHQGNTTQNHNEITTSHQSEWLKLTSQETTDVFEDVEKGESSYAAGVMQAGTATLENSTEVPQKVKNRATLRPSNCTTGYLPSRYKGSDRRGTCTRMFIAAISTIAKRWKEPVHPQMNG